MFPQNKESDSDKESDNYWSTDESDDALDEKIKNKCRVLAIQTDMEEGILFPSDVQVFIGDEIIECHRCVLHTFCEIFENGKQIGSIVHLPKDKVTVEAFQLAYSWMVTCHTDCTRSQLLDLLLAADYLRVPDLMTSVYEALSDEDLFKYEHAFKCFAEAYDKDMQDVVDLMLHHVGKMFLVLVATDAFLELDINALCRFLSSDLIGVHSEIEVFYGGLLWVLGDYKNRQIHTRRVLTNVRFELMPSMISLDFNDMLQEMLPESTNQMYFMLNLATIHSQQRSILPLATDMPRNRILIRDPICPYLSLLDDRTVELSAARFKEYVVLLERTYENFSSRIIDLADVTES